MSNARFDLGEWVTQQRRIIREWRGNGRGFLADFRKDGRPVSLILARECFLAAARIARGISGVVAQD